VLSQIADEANAATPTVPTAPPSSGAVQFEQLSDHLKQQQAAMNSLEQKVDFLADLLHRICDFLGLPIRSKPSCEPPPTNPTVDCQPAEDILPSLKFMPVLPTSAVSPRNKKLTRNIIPRTIIKQ